MNHPNRNRPFDLRLSAAERGALLNVLDIIIADMRPGCPEIIVQLRGRIAALELSSGDSSGD